MQKCSYTAQIFTQAKKARVSYVSWPLTSKSPIYDRFLTHFSFMRVNNSRPRWSVIFIHRSTRCIRVSAYKCFPLPAQRKCVYIYMCVCARNAPRVPAFTMQRAYIYLLHFLSAAINFRSTFSLLDTSRKNEEEEPRHIRRQPRRKFARYKFFPKDEDSVR